MKKILFIRLLPLEFLMECTKYGKKKQHFIWCDKKVLWLQAMWIIFGYFIVWIFLFFFLTASQILSSLRNVLAVNICHAERPTYFTVAYGFSYVINYFSKVSSVYQKHSEQFRTETNFLKDRHSVYKLNKTNKRKKKNTNGMNGWMQNWLTLPET